MLMRGSHEIHSSILLTLIITDLSNFGLYYVHIFKHSNVNEASFTKFKNMNFMSYRGKPSAIKSGLE